MILAWRQLGDFRTGVAAAIATPILNQIARTAQICFNSCRAYGELALHRQCRHNTGPQTQPQN